MPVPENIASDWGALALGGAPVNRRRGLRRVTALGPAPVGSPDWWVKRLSKKLADQFPIIDRFEDYYCGDHPLPWLAPQAAEEFRRILRMTRANYMGLVVDAQVERMVVEGFAIGKTTTAEGKTISDELWRIWQANDLDGESDQAWLEAAKSGCAYALVGPNPEDEKTPIVSIEHPREAIVEYVPGSRRKRAAGLKLWKDEWTATLSAELHLPGWVVPYRAAGETLETATRWDMGVPRRTGVDRVCLVALPNNPRLALGGVSELADLTDTQDRINKTLADRLITQDYGAFPQKWASAYPDTDEKGNPVDPIDVGRNRLVTTNIKETKFGQFEAAPLDPYSNAKREDVKDIASRSRTPSQYLLGEMSNVNGETLKASESGLVAKVRRRQRGFDSGIEEVQSLVAIFAKLADKPFERIGTLWRDPQYRTEGEAADAAVKKFQSSIVPLRQTRQDLRYSPEQITAMEQADQEERDRDPLATLLRPPAGSGDANNGG